MWWMSVVGGTPDPDNHVPNKQRLLGMCREFPNGAGGGVKWIIYMEYYSENILPVIPPLVVFINIISG